MKKIEILSQNNSYNIFVGEGTIDFLNENINEFSKKIIITDENIFKLGLHKKIKVNNLVDVVVVKANESSKSFETVMEVLEKLSDNNFTRSDVLIALGGGVVGDLTGFVASIYQRGIKFVQVPTTLLAMVDSSVGGKTAINFLSYKNSVGSFYNPALVIVDIDFLDTLDKRQFLSGLVEIIKMGLIYDKKIFDLLYNHNTDEVLEDVVIRSITCKKEVVEVDEKEKGLRKILNFGHTIGHGVESYFGCSKVLHGEAVAYGMVKMIDDKLILELVINIFEKNNIKYFYEYDKDKVLDIIKHDKKALNNEEIEIILLKEVGCAYIKKVSYLELENRL
ncbi:MAG: 3-dehydroquinate synthase [Lachnospirales bacterium]